MICMPNLQSTVCYPKMAASKQLFAPPFAFLAKSSNPNANTKTRVKTELGVLPLSVKRKTLPQPADFRWLANQRQVPVSPLTRSPPPNTPDTPENPESPENPDEPAGGAREHDNMIQPSLKRYVVLFLFCLNAGNKAFQWIQIPAATKKVTYFYDVENFVINSMSVIFMLTFVLASWPACYLIERIGMRRTVVLASLGTLLGSLVKCFSCYEGGIYLLFIGQILVSSSEQLIFSVPSRLASVWFPDHQVSSAVALSILGNQLGVALGFVVPQFVLDAAESKQAIGAGLQLMFLGTAGLSLVAFVASLALFDEAPRYAPGAARLKQMEEERRQALASGPGGFVAEMRLLAGQIKHLLANKSFNLLALGYGITISINYALQTVLNQMLEPIWPQDDILVGNTGFIIIISGAVCSPMWGKLLDSKHRYLLIYNLLTLATISSLLTFGYVVSELRSRLAIYLAAAFFGCFQTGLLVTGLELAVELTYPAAELVTSSVMNVPPQIFGTVFVFVASYLVDSYGAIATNLFFVVCFLVALTMLLNITERLKRQDAVIEQQSRHLP